MKQKRAFAVLDALSCGYGDRRGLCDLSLRFSPGQTFALLGPGGAGKSTLLHLLGGVAAPSDAFWTSGKLHVAFDRCAMLEQKTTLDARPLRDLVSGSERPGRSLEERIRQVWNHQAEAEEALLSRADEALADLPRSLVRLAALTGTMAHSADTYLLDEPDAGLEERHLAWLIDLLARLRGSASIVVATHNLKLARTISDRSILLVGGELIESGPTRSMFEQPKHPRTRSFVYWGS